MLDLVILHALGKRFSLLHLAALLLVYRLYTLFILRPYNTAAEPQQAISAIFGCSLTSIAVFDWVPCSQAPVLHENGLKAFCVSLICFLFTAICSPLQASTSNLTVYGKASS
jgi:predicted exporter